MGRGGGGQTSGRCRADFCAPMTLQVKQESTIDEVRWTEFAGTAKFQQLIPRVSTDLLNQLRIPRRRFFHFPNGFDLNEI